MESIEWITDRRSFAAIAEQWDRVATTSRTPFLLSAWIEAWLAAFAPDRRVLIAVLWRDGELAGGIPLLSGWRQWDAPANYHTPAFDLPAVDASARARLVEAVLARSNALILPGLAEDEPLLGEFAQAARRARRWTLSQTRETHLVVDTRGEVERYRAGLSTKVRSELGRLRRKAEREHDVTFEVFGRPRNLDAQLARSFALEASGWKGRVGTAILNSPQTEQFYSRVARDFESRGELRLSELTLDGDLAAMAITIIHRQRAFTIRVAYDERYRAVGPGFLLLQAMVEQCFELGLEAYEFGGFPYEYERRFATSQRERRALRIYRPTAVNAARYAYHLQIRPALRAGYRAMKRARAALTR